MNSQTLSASASTITTTSTSTSSPSPSSSSNDIQITIHTSASLDSNPKLLHSLVSAINTAFARHSAWNGTPRFHTPSELPTELGPDSGLCAIAHSGPTILGSASLRQWRPQANGAVDAALRSMPQDLKLADAGQSYEVKAVITVDTPRARGKGLAGLMIQALLEKVQRERHGGKEVLLWIQLAEEQNGEYWRRRGGFERVGPVEMMPKGTWGCTHEFEFLTMVRRVPAIEAEAEAGG
ncbi:uncharacterized protein HMPREF1541_04874 [Cyphellophora europaea CBS 101466]|uniref:Uncharacterized protein n=1 Tax=Cyphellophora europaea (strain CBS 101466) TaxID=1220924 RepID=W2RVW7_CYPE1|nr:uncharacterized protein HMPREF1541_04874 [Cyphellophora europaea CBS 101466]ETN40597.1 hypothetical protein HMPREF1541_04874 [Cyphellophora europaea CBS 101466]